MIRSRTDICEAARLSVFWVRILRFSQAKILESFSWLSAKNFKSAFRICLCCAYHFSVIIVNIVLLIIYNKNLSLFLLTVTMIQCMFLFIVTVTTNRNTYFWRLLPLWKPAWTWCINVFPTRATLLIFLQRKSEPAQFWNLQASQKVANAIQFWWQKKPSKSKKLTTASFL